jgi:ATP-dependent DNA ligase
MSLRDRTRPGLEIIEPCLPSPAKAPPSGPGWIHEIKHDGFRILARRGSAGVRLITRNGCDFTDHFPSIAMALKSLPVRSCMIDGEAIVCDANGLAVFELIRGHGRKTPRSLAPSTCWNLTERICDDARSRSEKAYWQNCSTIQTQM